MHSAIYTGLLRHRRFAPRGHEFSYRLFMMYVDLSEMNSVFKNRWLWSVKRPALAWLRRADYLGDASIPLDQAVRDRVETETRTRPTGPIRMLTHLRYFGLGFNPVTFYYCYDKDDTRIETIVAEITNTPWKERHAYVLSDICKRQPRFDEKNAEQVVMPAEAGIHSGDRADAKMDSGLRRNDEPLRYVFAKAFHVSPFLSMDYEYDWRFNAPSERLSVHMQNMQADNKVFDATLDLKRREISSAALASALLSFPVMTANVIVGIYWQALRLWLKRIPFYSHPKAHESRKALETADLPETFAIETTKQK